MVEVKERPKTRGEHAAAHTIRKVGIIGAGQMGSGIAHVCALSGFDVLLNDVAAERISAGLSHHQRQPGAPGQPPAHHRRAAAGRAQAHRRRPDLGRPLRLRPRDRGGDREGGRQAQDLRRALPDAQARRHRRHQHLLDLDHAACRRDRPAGALHRHPLHESGAADGAGRADPRHRHRRRDLRDRPSSSSPSSARPSRCRRTFPPSSSTASCCR